MVLITLYHEGHCQELAAAALGCSLRKRACLIPAARQHRPIFSTASNCCDSLGVSTRPIGS